MTDSIVSRAEPLAVRHPAATGPALEAARRILADLRRRKLRAPDRTTGGADGGLRIVWDRAGGGPHADLIVEVRPDGHTWFARPDGFACWPAVPPPCDDGFIADAVSRLHEDGPVRLFLPGSESSPRAREVAKTLIFECGQRGQPGPDWCRDWSAGLAASSGLELVWDGPRGKLTVSIDQDGHASYSVRSMDPALSLGERQVVSAADVCSALASTLKAPAPAPALAAPDAPMSFASAAAMVRAGKAPSTAARDALDFLDRAAVPGAVGPSRVGTYDDGVRLEWDSPEGHIRAFAFGTSRRVTVHSPDGIIYATSIDVALATLPPPQPPPTGASFALDFLRSEVERGDVSEAAWDRAASLVVAGVGAGLPVPDLAVADAAREGLYIAWYPKPRRTPSVRVYVARDGSMSIGDMTDVRTIDAIRLITADLAPSRVEAALADARIRSIDAQYSDLQGTSDQGPGTNQQGTRDQGPGTRAWPATPNADPESVPPVADDFHARPPLPLEQLKAMLQGHSDRGVVRSATMFLELLASWRLPLPMPQGLLHRDDGSAWMAWAVPGRSLVLTFPGASATDVRLGLYVGASSRRNPKLGFDEAIRLLRELTDPDLPTGDDDA